MKSYLRQALVGLALLCGLTCTVQARQKLQGFAGIDRQLMASAEVAASTTAPPIKVFPGCTVTVFITGTDTLATLYEDESGTPKDNPFTADAATAAWSFYADNGAYDLRLSGAGIQSPFRLGALTVSDPREVYNIKNFGGLCNGTSSDDAAVHAAFSAAAAGGNVYVPGVCTITSTIIPAAGTIITGGGASSNGKGGSESYMLRTTTPNMAIITIPGRRNRIVIRDLNFQSTTNIGTTAIKFFGLYAQPSSAFRMENLVIKGFDKAISVDTDTRGSPGEWECDNVIVSHVEIAEVHYGIWINTQNADYWLIENCAVAGHYGIYLNKAGFITLNQVVGTNVTDPGGLPAEREAYGPNSTFIIYTGANAGLTIEDCQSERFTDFINTKSAVGAADGNRISMIHSLPGGPIKLRFTQDFNSRDNKYVMNSVKALGTAAGFSGNDIIIHSSGDEVLDCSSGACVRAAAGSTPFDLSQSTNSFVVEEFGRFRTRIDGSYSNGLTVTNHLGVGNQQSSASAVVTIGTTAPEQSNNKPSIRLTTTAPGIEYNTFRDNFSGIKNEIATQADYRGFWFNSQVYTPTHVFLTNRSVTDGVTNGTTLLHSETARFVSGDVGAQVTIASTRGVLTTSIASVMDSKNVVLTLAPSWTATGNNIIITKSSGVIDSIGTGAPSGTCQTGSTYRRTDGDAGVPALYVCEGGNWAAK